jgi:hypothetical protein
MNTDNKAFAKLLENQTPTRTIGLKLALAQALHEARSTEQMRAEAAAKGDEEKRKFEVVESFYSEVREQIVAAVEAGDFHVVLLVGSDGVRSQFTEIVSLLNIPQGAKTYADINLHLGRKQHKYYCLWRDFHAWIVENELDVKWQYRWDDGGIHTWHEIQVQPNALVSRQAHQCLEREASRG